MWATFQRAERCSNKKRWELCLAETAGVVGAIVCYGSKRLDAGRLRPRVWSGWWYIIQSKNDETGYRANARKKQIKKTINTIERKKNLGYYGHRDWMSRGGHGEVLKGAGVHCLPGS